MLKLWQKGKNRERVRRELKEFQKKSSKKGAKANLIKKPQLGDFKKLKDLNKLQGVEGIPALS